MVYDQPSILARIKATLPGRWFGEVTPVLNSTLGSLAEGWVGLFGILNYTKMQTRIGTAFDGWLDMIARDFFGHRIRRRPQEADDSFRHRIYLELVRDRCTRSAIYDVLQQLTGRPPRIFEPTNPSDTGCFGNIGSPEVGRAGYCISGGWGNLDLPFQAFVRAFRPIPSGIAMINGWGGSIGGFGIGLSSYISPSTNLSWADDPEIYNAVAQTVSVGTIIWMSIEP
jgi:hypothetical protein